MRDVIIWLLLGCLDALGAPPDDADRLRGINDSFVHGLHQEIFNEITMFPIAAHDDLLDAAMFGTEWLLNRPEPRVFDL